MYKIRTVYPSQTCSPRFSDVGPIICAVTDIQILRVYWMLVLFCPPPSNQYSILLNPSFQFLLNHFPFHLLHTSLSHYYLSK